MVIDHDAELRAHDRHLRAGAAIAAGERVLDLGCGAGETTRAAAERAAEVLGVDVSEAALALARERTTAPHVRYLLADAQTHPFPPAHFDVAISRFGVMFFADPVAAFANVARALRPDGRLALLVWQSRDRNEWARELDVDEGPYSLGDPAHAERVLTAAGFAQVDFADVHEPIYFGPDLESALAFVQPFARAADVRATVAAHLGEGGVVYDSRAWLVSARRAPAGAGR